MWTKHCQICREASQFFRVIEGSKVADEHCELAGLANSSREQFSCDRAACVRVCANRSESIRTRRVAGNADYRYAPSRDFVHCWPYVIWIAGGYEDSVKRLFHICLKKLYIAFPEPWKGPEHKLQADPGGGSCRRTNACSERIEKRGDFLRKVDAYTQSAVQLE